MFPSSRTPGGRRAFVPVLALLVLLGCGEAGAPSSHAAAELTEEELRAGASLFARHCAGCHGADAEGTPGGPPLVHRVYAPGHHSDFAFVLAIRQGVRAHHWRFGDMPPVEGIAPEQERLVIGYVRRLQRRAGIH